MDDEKLEKTIEFILNNQAQFTVDIQLLQESQKEAEKRFNTLERVSLRLYESVAKLAESVGELTENVEEMRQAQTETDERLNTVILMVEKFFSGENGNPKKKK